ncbi:MULTISPECIES: AAA family ATPase [Fusobacterium]|uniref:AAA family ATPase n=1 Tax=Fusobacterium TaxID=848 RepID=UPI001C6DE21B|nr:MULTISPECIES: AAA family ATPase [Fusobacterium]QYR64229.1 AAA family ATPase [Fusobacterium animalis]WDD89066.1 AAA family ATPase [Fusobacterium nucleatum]
MKKLPIGLSDFKKLIEGNYYYFDKTNFIDEIIKDGSEVKLFTRPRRFGKTLNMSMLKYFFDIKEAEENRKLFKDLYIEKTENFKEQGQYPVIFLSLKDLKADNWESMANYLKVLISNLCLENKYLLKNLDSFDKDLFESYINKNAKTESLKDTLKFLTRILYEKYNKKVVVLIDEYDAPLVSAYHNKYYEKAKDFFKTFYSSVLKDNVYLQMGVMTGIIRVIKAGIFSDLNNLNTYTILSDFYPNCYGLTEEEVKKALIAYNLEYEMGDVKDWYDGYRFGKSEVYNPWSILNFLHAKELRAYWVDTSGNDLINDVLKIVRKDIVRDLKKLFDGKGLKQNLSGTSDLSRILSEEEIWELMLFSGYLTVEEKIDEDYYILRLPNREVRRLFKRTFIEKYFGRGNKLIDLMEALTENRIEDYEETLQDILLKSVSYNDTKKGNEAFYHGFILGMSLYLEGEYIVKSNIESGLGRYDVSIEPKNKNKRGYILEFKATDNVDKLEEISKEALEQIEEGKYSSTLKQTETKEILYLGIAFCGKQIKVGYK